MLKVKTISSVLFLSIFNANALAAGYYQNNYPQTNPYAVQAASDQEATQNSSSTTSDIIKWGVAALGAYVLIKSAGGLFDGGGSSYSGEGGGGGGGYVPLSDDERGKAMRVEPIDPFYGSDHTAPPISDFYGSDHTQ
ncbi:hypothetical protein [Methylomagnum ishizawai]|uniref:hypothetical protein n=1 Tax=Methylomagnum ishizawai TaxID=1760988 RepID=UPI000F73DDDF|nr:hypothetical protein [Methylomagnum ishizawai]